MNNLLKDKTILIMGVANKWSIAWGVAQSCIDAGANIILTYQGERSESSIQKLIGDTPHINLYKCDVTQDQDIIDLFSSIKEDFGTIHGIVHSIAFAKREELEGAYYNTSREGYHLAQDISAYSLVAIAKYGHPLLTKGGSILTMTYLGGERAVPNYNVMGVAKSALESSVRYLAADLGPKNIRVNSISAGPIKTLAAQGVKGLGQILKIYEEKVPLRRTVTQGEVGDTATFLLSNLSRGITGENIHVDAGYHAIGLL
ncbi:MAG TPA: enoyl-ACP reductase FabI [Clostridia bacterium]|nr:enoyl-ACP reductase FabI [Clostridia bacterium]